MWFNPSAWVVKVSLTVGVLDEWQLSDHLYVQSASGTRSVNPYRTGAMDGSLREPELVAAAYPREAHGQLTPLRETHADDRVHRHPLPVAG